MKKSSYLYELNLSEEITDLRGKVPAAMSADAVKARFLYTKGELPSEVTVIDPVDPAAYPASFAYEVFVSPDGDDAAEGSKAAPIATLAEAARRVAGKGGATVTLRGGKYVLSESVTFGEEHSGREGAPLFLRAYPGERVSLTGNTPVSTAREKWAVADPATDPVAARLPAAARGKVICTRLADHGLTPADIPEIGPKKEGPPSLLVGGEAYTLARYPNASPDPYDLLYFVYVYETGRCTVRDGSDLYWSWIDRCKAAGWDPMKEVGWEIRVVDEKQWEVDRPEEHAHKDAAAEITSWVNTGDIWYYGSTFEGWEFGYYNLALDTEGQYWAHTEDGRRWTPGDGIPYLGTPKAEMAAGQNPNGTSAWGAEAGYSLKSVQPNAWGTKVSGNSPVHANTYYLFNAIEALDEPGEWFLDRRTGILYLYPKDDSFFGADMSFSSKNLSAPLILSGLAHAVVEGITVDGTGDVGITLDHCFDLVLQHVKVANTKKENLLIEDCRRTAVIYSDFSRAGTVLVKFKDGKAHYDQRASLNLLQNNFFHDPAPMRQHAMLFAGCRSVISHNYFRNTCMDSSTASECIIEYNRFEGGNADVVDGGMYYASGPAVRNNHVRYNLFHMFNATHQALYFDTMCGGNYAYGNIVSTLGSKTNRHKGWYSSTGHGNVCSGNIFILRDPWEIASANSRGGDEEENFVPGDNLNQSGLFFYYFDNEHAAVSNRKYALVAEGREELYPVDYAPSARSLVLFQSMAGHWWEGMKAGEVKSYLKDRDPAIIEKSDPTYAYHLWGTAVVLDALENSDYRVKYFYLPARLTGKSYTSSAAPAGTPIVIPAYSYLDEDYREVEVPAHTVTVSKDGKVTLTYEELAAMERVRRAPAYCVIENNMVLGGTPLCDPVTKAVIGDADPEYMINDSLAYVWYEDADGTPRMRNAYGYRKTSREGHNFLLLDFARIVKDARGFDYTVREEAVPELADTLEPEAMGELLSLSQGKTGPTYGFDYASLGPVQKK